MRFGKTDVTTHAFRLALKSYHHFREKIVILFRVIFKGSQAKPGQTPCRVVIIHLRILHRTFRRCLILTTEKHPPWEIFGFEFPWLYCTFWCCVTVPSLVVSTISGGTLCSSTKWLTTPSLKVSQRRASTRVVEGKGDRRSKMRVKKKTRPLA